MRSIAIVLSIAVVLVAGESGSLFSGSEHHFYHNENEDLVYQHHAGRRILFTHGADQEFIILVSGKDVDTRRIHLSQVRPGHEYWRGQFNYLERLVKECNCLGYVGEVKFEQLLKRIHSAIESHELHQVFYDIFKCYGHREVDESCCQQYFGSGWRYNSVPYGYGSYYGNQGSYQGWYQPSIYHSFDDDSSSEHGIFSRGASSSGVSARGGGAGMKYLSQGGPAGYPGYYGPYSHLYMPYGTSPQGVYSPWYSGYQQGGYYPYGMGYYGLMNMNPWHGLGMAH